MISYEVLERAQLRPRVIDEHILSIIGANRFLATFDGCQTFISWHASQNDLLVQQSKPEYCQHDATRLCPDVTRFEGDRQLQLLNLRFAPHSGSISFLVKSKAFKDEGTFSVSSQDKGKTWTTKAFK